MKSALKKELFSLAHNFHYLFIVGVFFVVAILENAMENENTYGFLIIFILISSMVGFNSLSSDNMSKWDKLITALPIHSKHSVVAKYVFNFAFCAGLLIILVLIKQTLFWGGVGMDLIPLLPVLVALFGIFILYSALNFVFIFAFGIEKVQIIMIAFLGLMGGCVGFVISDNESFFVNWLTNINDTTFCVVFIIGVVLYFASMPLSIYLYDRRIKK